MKKEHLSWKQFDEGCKELAKQIKQSKFKPEVIFTIPRGGLPIATRLGHLLNVKKIATDKTDFLQVGRKIPNILFIDDVSDTGGTILRNFIFSMKIATLHYKPCSRVKPDFYVWENDKWIVYPWEEK